MNALPRGIASFPEYTAKAALPRMIYDAYDRPALDPELPAPVRELALHPPPVSVFIPEVHMRTLLSAIADSLDIDDETFVADALRISRDFLSSPMWKALFWLVSPERVLKNSQSRWEAFHRGISVEVTSMQPGRATVVMRAPPFLDTLVMARCNVMGIQAALEAAGGKEVCSACTQPENGLTDIVYTWR